MQNPGYLNLRDKKVVDIDFTKKSLQIALNEYLNIWDTKKPQNHKFKILYRIHRDNQEFIIKENPAKISGLLLELVNIYVARGKAIWIKNLRGNISNTVNTTEYAFGENPEEVRILFSIHKKFIDLDEILEPSLQNFYKRYARYNKWVQENIQALKLAYANWDNIDIFEQMAMMYHIMEKKLKKSKN